MATLNVVPADLVTYAGGHADVATQIEFGLQADGPAIAAMTTGYGSVGASLTTAIGEFETALHTCGTALAGEYRRTSQALHTTSGVYVKTDEQNGAALSPGVTQV